jgi:D-beta-D-heptose 7-phosphate kinase/D-beta-D-heptose 1-phosphate adenosyltransferase
MSLASLLDRFAGRSVLVIGDVMLDHFQIGRVDRISPEAPVPVMRFEREEYRLGGAANVAHNLSALGATTRLVGVIGEDDAARLLRDALTTAGVDSTGLVTDASRPTTRKIRLVTTRNQQVARVDHEADHDVSGETLEALTTMVATAVTKADAVVLSDYRKGAVAPAVIRAAADAASQAGVPLLVDPKVPTVDRYTGASLITPNHHEAELMTQTSIRTHDDAREAARLLHARTHASVLITWGEHGMWVLDGSGGARTETALPAVAREVADVTGAGDTVIAALALGLAAGAPLTDAARLANIAAGLVVGRFGPSAISAAELRAAAGQRR